MKRLGVSTPAGAPALPARTVEPDDARPVGATPDERQQARVQEIAESEG